MSYEIINNLSVKNHGYRIKELIQKSDAVIIASPFLLPEFSRLLTELSWNSTRSFHLITTLVPKSEDQVKKISSLNNLVAYSRTYNIDCKISINNKLHGKIYIFMQGGIYFAAIISSANMTENGMSKLDEWGVFITEKEIIKSVHDDLLSSIQFLDIKHFDIIQMFKKAKEYLTKNEKPVAAKINLNLINLVTGIQSLQLNGKTKYWLKPIGYTLEHVNPNEPFDQKTKNLHFAKDEPTDVVVGDILIAFAVGSGKILSIYRVDSLPEYTKKEDRWPWYVKSTNLTVAYGANWWKNNLTKEYLKELFEKRYPGLPIKPTGVQSFGAFNWGWDRLKITSNFGKFILENVLEKQL